MQLVHDLQDDRLQLRLRRQARRILLPPCKEVHVGRFSVFAAEGAAACREAAEAQPHRVLAIFRCVLKGFEWRLA